MCIRDRYESLPDDLKEIFDECMEDYEKIMRDYGVERQQKTLEELQENGMKMVELTDAEKQQWIDASQVVYGQMEDIIGKDVIAEAKKILGK